MKKRKVFLCLCLLLLIVAIYLNWKYEVIAVNPFRNEGQPELTVMTWNVHCSKGADSIRQRKIAELILKEDLDVILLNEFFQDSCLIIDSLLRVVYPYTEETMSHNRSGDIIYSKRALVNSGRFHIILLKRFQPSLGGESFPDSLRGKSPCAIVTTAICGQDSIRFFGVHLASNRIDDIFQNGNPFSYEVVNKAYNQYSEAQDRRAYQIHWIKEVAVETSCPVIVMGDMNDFNCAAPLDTLTSCGLRDAWWEGGNGYGATFHKGWMRLRIDHILHSKDIKLERIKVIETNLSDHNPVVAGFSLRKN